MDLPRAPGLRRQPLAHVVAVAQWPPLQTAAAAIDAFALVSATLVHQRDDKSTLGKLCGILAQARARDVRIALLENAGYLPSPFGR
ncbi:MAG: hypothetical protein WCN98_19450 [Verrucomicrobiaceae bacterium]